MRKILLPFLWALALVALPFSILLTGNATLEPVLEYSVYAYASLALTFGAITGLSVLASVKMWGRGLGAGPHKRLMASYFRLKDMSFSRILLSPLTCLVSHSFLTLIGLSTLAGLILCAALLVVGTRLAILHYGKKHDVEKAQRMVPTRGFAAY